MCRDDQMELTFLDGVTGLVAVSGNDEEGWSVFFGGLERTQHCIRGQLAFPELKHLMLALGRSVGGPSLTYESSSRSS